MKLSTRKMFPAPPADLQLQSRRRALAAAKGLVTLSHEAHELAKPQPGSTTAGSCGGMAMGDTLPWGTETPTCQCDLLSREVFCLLGFSIQVSMTPQKVLFFHVGTSVKSTQTK